MKPLDEDEIGTEGRGRSARKREAKAIEQLAQELADMADIELAKLPLHDDLAKEVEQARNTKGHSSRKRQTEEEHTIDLEALAAAIAAEEFASLENAADRES